MALSFMSGALWAASNYASSYASTYVNLAPPPPTHVTISHVQSDLTKVANQTNVLHAGALAFASDGKPGTLTEAMAIYNDACSLMTTVERAATTLKALTPCPLSESDGRALFIQLLSLEPAVASGLSELQAKKSALIALGLSRPEVITILGQPRDLIHGALLNAKESFVKFRAALLLAAPLEMSPQAEAVGQQIEAHFDNAIACYGL